MSREDFHSGGPMAMVRIDGTTIRRLREEQGVTQLYVATAVSVTTDTISRWENGRYPSIKRDNALKLAEALEVDLSELLLDDSEETGSTAEPGQNSTDPGSPLPRASAARQYPKLLIASTAGCLLVIILVVVFRGGSAPAPKETPVPEVTRSAPAWSLPEELVPVSLTVNSTTGETTVMIKEEIAQAATVAEITPSPAGDDHRAGGEIRWLGKVHSNRRYSYLLRPSGNPGDRVNFTGSWATSTSSERETGGSQSLELSSWHWADVNKDHVIDDREIILVYDRYSDLPGFGSEIDRVEEIWLGVGYRWDNSRRKLIILHRKKREEIHEK